MFCIENNFSLIWQRSKLNSFKLIQFNVKKNGLNCAFLLILLNRQKFLYRKKKMVNLRGKISFKEIFSKENLSSLSSC